MRLANNMDQGLLEILSHPRQVVTVAIPVRDVATTAMRRASQRLPRDISFLSRIHPTPIQYNLITIRT
jgi:ribosomal protein L16/L10AE